VLNVTARQLRATLAVLFGIVIGLGAYFGFGALRGDPTGAAPSTAPEPTSWVDSPRFGVTAEDSPARGPADAPVTVVEFTDYECSFCREYATTVLPALLERHGDNLRYIVRNSPNPVTHMHAVNAAEAAECAHRQGSFWEYHDALFQDLQFLTAERLRAHAADLGLDAIAFSQCLDDGATRDIVARDLLDGLQNGVSGTPTFFVNGRRLRGVKTLEEMEEYIALALLADEG
jgi:protein-disulfide isomerase